MASLPFFMLALIALGTGGFLYTFNSLGLITRTRAIMLVCTGFVLMAGVVAVTFG